MTVASAHCDEQSHSWDQRGRPGHDGEVVHTTKAALPGGLDVGAGDEIRTRDIHLGKVMLYQLSYSRLLWVCSMLLYKL